MRTHAGGENKVESKQIFVSFFFKMFTDNLGCLQGVSLVVKKNYDSFSLILVRTVLTLPDNLG